MKKNIYKSLSNVVQGLFALAVTVVSGSAYSQATYTFVYTGSSQTINLTAGNYSFECWGADGGDANNGSVSMFGGKGGYATGTFSNTNTGIFNIYVGGKGGNASGSSNIGGGGGGMSDIAPASNSTLVIIAAAGGGGATAGSSSESSTGGGGGGLTGGTAIDGTGVSTGAAATGGSQTAGGFATAGSYGAGAPGGYGYGGGAANGGASGTMHGAGGSGGSGGAGGWNGGGGSSTSTSGNEHSGGGGAGYYGGGGGRGDGGAGGGGSSYIGGVTSGTTIMFGQSGFVNNPDPNGNGRVIIRELCSVKIASSSGTVTPVILCAGNSLTLTTDAVSNYTWSTGATSNSIVVAPTSNTMISVTGTSSMNCTSTGVINIVVSSGLPVLSISNPSNNICLGRTVSLTATGALTYTWSNPGVVNGQTFTPNSTAVYTVSGENGCGITTATTTITVAPLPISVLASPALVCQGYPSTLTAVSSVGNYTWEPGSLPGNTVVVAPTANIIYTVSATDGTCSGTQTVAVNTQPTPTISVSAPFISLCEGEVATISATGADSYTWNPGNLSGSSVTVSPNAPTLYVVTGEYTNGCSSSNQIAVVVVNAPTLSINASKTTVCSGATVALTASGGDAYQWVNGPASAGFTVTPTVSSTYTVTGTHSTNSCVATKTIDITAIVPNVTFPTNTMVCVGGSVMLTASGANTYVWGSQSTGTVNTFVMQPTATTTLTITANTTSGSVVCPETQTVEVTVNPLPTLSVTAQRATMCRFETNTLTVTGAQTYDWGTLGTTNTVVITPTTTLAFYAVTGTDANGCVKSFTYQAKVNTCSGIQDLETGNGQISVYPNPNAGIFTISTARDMQLGLFNELGQELRTFKVNEGTNTEINITDLSNGVYFLVGQDEGRTVHQKIIVTK